MIEYSAKVENAEDFIAVLRKSMPQAAGNGVIAGALLKASRPMVTQLKSLYRTMRRSGSLVTATRAWRVKRGRKFGAKVRIGPLRWNAAAVARYSREYGRTVGDIRHGHLVERGTKVRRTKTGEKRGQVTGRWPVRRAANATVSQCATIFRQVIGRDMDRAMAKRARSKGRR